MRWIIVLALLSVLGAAMASDAQEEGFFLERRSSDAAPDGMTPDYHMPSSTPTMDQPAAIPAVIVPAPVASTPAPANAPAPNAPTAPTGPTPIYTPAPVAAPVSNPTSGPSAVVPTGDSPSSASTITLASSMVALTVLATFVL